jgi:hypothetical protein
VSVVLVLVLFASCSAASDASDAAENARNAASSSGQQVGQPDPGEVQAMCRLLGAVARKQGIDIGAVFKDAPSVTGCQDVATAASTGP